jgi:hypothetical protein
MLLEFNKCIAGIALLFALIQAQPALSAEDRKARGLEGNAARDFLVSRKGTIETKAKSQFADGALVSCMIQFTALAQDSIYRGGQPVKIGGLFGIMNPQNKLGIVLKLTVNDIDPDTLKEIPATPDSAYLISGLNSSKQYLIAKQPPNVPGDIFVIFNIDGALEIVSDALNNKNITIAFNREPRGLDVQVPIDLTVEETTDTGDRKRSPKTIKEFLSCASELLEPDRTKAKPRK